MLQNIRPSSVERQGLLRFLHFLTFYLYRISLSVDSEAYKVGVPDVPLLWVIRDHHKWKAKGIYLSPSSPSVSTMDSKGTSSKVVPRNIC